MNNKNCEKNETTLSAKRAMVTIPFFLAAYSVFAYMVFLGRISSMLHGRAQAEFLNILGRDIPIQLILDNSFRIGVSVVIVVLIASFLVALALAALVKTLAALVKITVSASNALGNNFYEWYCKKNPNDACAELRTAFVPSILIVCLLVYLLIYFVSILVDIFKFFQMFL